MTIPDDIAKVARETYRQGEIQRIVRSQAMSCVSLTTRASNRVQGLTIGQVMDMSDAQLLAIPGMGQSTVSHIREAIGEFQARWTRDLSVRLPSGKCVFDLVWTVVWSEQHRCAAIAANYKRDASFDDSAAGALEHNANQANIARAILDHP